MTCLARTVGHLLQGFSAADRTEGERATQKWCAGARNSRTCAMVAYPGPARALLERAYSLWALRRSFSDAAKLAVHRRLRAPCAEELSNS